VSEGSSALVKESKETDFEEIEAWMKEHEGEDLMPEEVNGEDAISDEFNRFLEKRVEAVEKE